MNISFSTLGCPDWSWKDIIAQGPRLGYDGVEVRLLERETDLLGRPEFRNNRLPARRRELQEAGFRVSGLSSSVRFDFPSAKQRSAQCRIGCAYLQLAAELNADFVRVFGDVLPHSDASARQAAIRQIADGLQHLGEPAESLNVQVVLETHGDFSNTEVVRQVMELVESPAVGVLWDTHHPWRFQGEALADSFRRMRRWVRQVHWKDSVSIARRTETAGTHLAAEKAHALMSGHRHADYVLFGGGEFPIAECLAVLLESGFTGWHCYEWEKAWHPEIEDPHLALPLFPGKLRQYAELLQRASRRRTGRRTSGKA